LSSRIRGSSRQKVKIGNKWISRAEMADFEECCVDANKYEEIQYKKGRQAKKPWVTEEMLKKMEERRKVKHQCVEGAKKEYQRLNNE